MPNTTRSARTATLCFVASVLVAGQALADHGAVTNSAIYLTDNFIELDGEITEVFWRNPHTRAHMSVIDENGEEMIWELERGRGAGRPVLRYRRSIALPSGNGPQSKLATANRGR